ncbi:MAG: OmpA family protein [Flammeovirgaceae bacterium]|nr:OmpA family protein [Flammeovirgaceae bacterium]MDW8286969.1 OmpA family protein [Flammeovirgaceae bacterium]
MPSIFMIMRCSMLGIAIGLLSPLAFSQVQWASRVINFSSEYVVVGREDAPRNRQYRAVQVLGKPNVLPQGGSSPCAWSPAKESSDKDEWIKVGFSNPVPIQQVAVCESHNAGSIIRIFAYDIYGTEHLLYKNNEPAPAPEKSRVFRVFLDTKTYYPVSAIKVVLRTKAVVGWNHIDAIAISESLTPIEAEINLSNIHSEEVEPINEAVNSPYDEMNPVVADNGKKLYFVRRNHPDNTPSHKLNNDIWVSDWTESGWTTAKLLPPPINNEHHNYIASVTLDGKRLILGNTYLKDGKMKGGISYSNLSDKGWTYPEPITVEGFHNKSPFADYYLASNGKILLLSIEGEDSFGDRDLYVSFLQNNGVWSKPLNLGHDINTAAADITPFLAADEKTIFFASQGYSGYGSMDIFMSKRADDSWTSWSEPVNLGSSFNSPNWESSFVIDEASEYAYFASAKTNPTNADIYRAKLPPALKPIPLVMIIGKVYNAKTKEPIAAEIVYERLSDGVQVGTAYSEEETGNYKITLPVNALYGYWAKSTGFLSVSENIDLQLVKQYREIQKDLYLVPLEIGQTLILNNLFFEQSKNTLLKESYPELNRLVRTLLDNPSVEFILEGHTDLEGDPQLNYELSEKRVKMVKDYLVEKGIDPRRIETKAYGSTKPVTLDRNPESRKKNRRVEFKIKRM